MIQIRKNIPGKEAARGQTAEKPFLLQPARQKNCGIGERKSQGRRIARFFMESLQNFYCISVDRRVEQAEVINNVKYYQC